MYFKHVHSFSWSLSSFLVNIHCLNLDVACILYDTVMLSLKGLCVLFLNHFHFILFSIYHRLQFGVAIIGKQLFVVGGRDGLKTLNTVDCWDMQVRINLPAKFTH